jgi:hypothetical protein
MIGMIGTQMATIALIGVGGCPTRYAVQCPEPTLATCRERLALRIGQRSVEVPPGRRQIILRHLASAAPGP